MKKIVTAIALGIGGLSALAEESQTAILDLSPATEALTTMQSNLTTWISANSGKLIGLLVAFAFLVIGTLIWRVFKRGSKG